MLQLFLKSLKTGDRSPKKMVVCKSLISFAGFDFEHKANE